MNTCVILLEKSLKLRHCQVRWINTTRKQTPAEYCLNLVKNNDYESFLCTLLLPSDIRATAFAIRAFNTEVALVEDQVRDPKIGLIRLKFWEETLTNIYYNKPPANPTALELHRILQRQKLSKHYFKRLIDARFNKLNNSIFINLEALEKYTDYTVSSVYYLLLEAQGIKDVNTDHFASHLGKAHGIANIVRSVPYNAQRRNIALPQDILMKHSISAESIIQRQNNKKLKDVIFDVSSRAKQHLDKAISLKSQIKKESKVIFLPAIIVENYLNKLQNLDFDVFHTKLQKRDSLLPLKLYWRKSHW